MRHSMKVFSFLLTATIFGTSISYASPADASFNEGVSLYKEGRFSEATDAFEHAAKSRDHEKEAKDYIDRIRNETVERIRNRALTGIAKNTWQSKYYFMNTVDGRIQVGISIQELFERGSLNFRPGSLEALTQLAQTLRKTDSGRVDIQLISEIPLESQPDPQINAQQQAQVFSYLALAATDSLPTF